MFGLFSSDKKETKKVVSAPFDSFIGGAHFANSNTSQDVPRGKPVNLKGVVYLLGDLEVVISQNQTVTTKSNEMQIDRNSGLIIEKVEGTLGLTQLRSSRS